MLVLIPDFSDACWWSLALTKGRDAKTLEALKLAGEALPKESP